jgi:hypothetical protein
MSEIFEGIVSPAQATSFAEVHGRECGLDLETHDIGDGLTAVYRSDPREEATFSSKMDELAAEVSRQAGKVLLARFDSRVGKRSSAIFENGERRQMFAEADELYVPLDEKGDPVRDAPPLTLAMLDPKEEYETIQNAIQLGLRALGRGSWDELLRVITTS